MRYYFFQTSEQLRDGVNKPTLRALPGQTFPDGTPVDENLNVQAPKEKGSSANGNRLDYPNGTFFCSTYLQEVTTTNGKTYYSVYTQENVANKTDPDFFPVSDDPNFQYVSSQHRNDTMNAAYVQFTVFGTQTDDTPEMPSRKKASRPSGPADINGKARSPQGVFEQKYDDQLDTETLLIVQWMLKLLSDKNVRMMAKRPKADNAITDKVKDLFRSGETLDSITCRGRFDAVCKKEMVNEQGLSTIAKGPLEWYLDELLREHEKNGECTAVARSTEDKKDVEDAAFIITKEMDSMYGTMNPPSADPTIIPNITKAMENGWTLDEIIHPDILNQRDNIIQLADALATGVIPLQNKKKAGKTLFETIASDSKLKCPKAQDGFYVEEHVWRLLVRNLKVKQNTLITGPSGCGKTELIKKLCEVTNTPLTIIPMGGVTDVTEHLVGKLDLDPSTKGTKFDWAQFALAIQRPGVILLDEINRIPRGGANILYSVLDQTRTLMANGAKSTDVREIKVNPECCFFSTANIGNEYVDANEIDEAIRTRFCATIPLKFLDIKTETKVLENRTGISSVDAMSIAEVASNIRREYKKGTIQYNVSMRETLYTAELVRDGLSVEEALEYGVLVHYEQGLTENDASSEWGKVKALIASHFNSPKSNA